MRSRLRHRPLIFRLAHLGGSDHGTVWWQQFIKLQNCEVLQCKLELLHFSLSFLCSFIFISSFIFHLVFCDQNHQSLAYGPMPMADLPERQNDDCYAFAIHALNLDAARTWNNFAPKYFVIHGDISFPDLIFSRLSRIIVDIIAKCFLLGDVSIAQEIRKLIFQTFWFSCLYKHLYNHLYINWTGQNQTITQ